MHPGKQTYRSRDIFISSPFFRGDDILIFSLCSGSSAKKCIFLVRGESTPARNKFRFTQSYRVTAAFFCGLPSLSSHLYLSSASLHGDGWLGMRSRPIEDGVLGRLGGPEAERPNPIFILENRAKRGLSVPSERGEMAIAADAEGGGGVHGRLGPGPEAACAFAILIFATRARRGLSVPRARFEIARGGGVHGRNPPGPDTARALGTYGAAARRGDSGASYPLRSVSSLRLVGVDGGWGERASAIKAEGSREGAGARELGL